MFTTLTLSLALAAPVPPPAPPVPVGSPPRLMQLKADADGKIRIPVNRVGRPPAVNAPAVEPAPAPADRVPAARMVGRAPDVRDRELRLTQLVELADVKDLTVMTADGRKLTNEEAMRRLTAGTVVVVSTDGQPVSPVFLKVFKDDTLVLVSPEFAGITTSEPAPPAIGRPLPGRVIGPIKVQPLPAPVPAPLPVPAQPAVPAPQPPVQPIQPRGVQILPAQPGNVVPIQVVPIPVGAPGPAVPAAQRRAVPAPDTNP